MDHDLIIEAFAGGKVPKIGLPAIRHRHVVEFTKPCARLKRGISAIGRGLERYRKNLRKLDFTRGEDARPVAFEVEHGVVSDAHVAFEIFQ